MIIQNPLQNTCFNSSTLISLLRKIKMEQQNLGFIYHETNIKFLLYSYPSSKSFGEGTKIDFTGKNAEHFYNQIKKNQLDRKIFDLTKLIFARIDLYYLRHNKPGNTNQSVEDFMELSRRRVNTKDKFRKVSWDYEEYGLVYRVGVRGSEKYYRIYQTDSAHNHEELKFEFELKPYRLLEKLLIEV